jgi:hypothetical protein
MAPIGRPKRRIKVEPVRGPRRERRGPSPVEPATPKRREAKPVPA